MSEKWAEEGNMSKIQPGKQVARTYRNNRAVGTILEMFGRRECSWKCENKVFEWDARMGMGGGVKGSRFLNLKIIWLSKSSNP